MNNLDLEKKINTMCHDLIEQKGIVTTIDVLLNLNYLTKEDLDSWRFGKIPYLEKVCQVNLKKLSTINRLIKKTSKQMNLKPSWTAYNKYGRGVKTRLIFSKSGDENIEKEYATHYFVLAKYKNNRTNDIVDKPANL